MGSRFYSKLFDVADVIDSLHITPKYSESGYPMVRCVNIEYGSLDLSETKRVTKEVFKKYSKKYFPERGDIIITRVGANFGETAYVENAEFCLGQNTAAIKPKGIDPNYLYFILNSPNGRHQMNVLAAGAAQPTLSIKSIKSLQIPRLGEEQERKLAVVVSKLNNKIQLNRQINQTLEHMAQALFKSWFVDFDPVIDNALAAGNTIPDELQERAQRRQQQLAKPEHKPLPEAIRQLFPSEFELTEELGLVPKGWEVKKADEVADVAIGKTPPRKQSEWFSDSKQSNAVWVSIRDMGAVSAHISDSSEYLTQEAINKFNIKIVPKNSVLLSFKLTLGRVSIATCDLTTNEAIAHFSNPKHKLCKEYLYCYLKCFSYERLGSTSSIATAVNSKIIKAMPILMPSESILEAFEGASKGWLSRMEFIYSESSTLATLRDTLLPKLISGELRLPSEALAKSDQQPADAIA